MGELVVRGGWCCWRWDWGVVGDVRDVELWLESESVWTVPGYRAWVRVR